MSTAENPSDTFYGIILVRGHVAAGKIIDRYTQARICRYGDRYKTLRVSGTLYDTETPPRHRELEDSQNLDSAVARALKYENALLKKGWRIGNREIAQHKDGIERVARRVGVERLLVGMDPPRHTWVYTPTRFGDWQNRAAEQGLRVINPPS